MELLRWIWSLLAIVALSACGSAAPPQGGGPSETCSPACGSNQRCADGECLCVPGFLDCDGEAENGCEIEGDECEVTLGEHELCAQGRESFGSCASGLNCVLVGGAGFSVCLQPCSSDQDCPGTRSCFGTEGGARHGICLEFRQAGESCTRWWVGPHECAERRSVDDPYLYCLDGICRIACHYQDENGKMMTCPSGQICGGVEIEYPEYPGNPIMSCIDKPERDPCREVPSGGRCSSYQSYEQCVVDGELGASLVEVHCKKSERCENGPEGAACVPIGPLCNPGHNYCDGDDLHECQKDGSWEITKCPGACRERPPGAQCIEEVPPVTIQGTILYEHFEPNDSFTGWSKEPVRLPAVGLLVVSFQGSEAIDYATVEEDGSFSIGIPEQPGPEDRLVLRAVGAIAGAEGPHFRVGDPGLPPGMHSTQNKGDWDAQVWQWSIAADEVAGATFVIEEPQGSPAVQIFTDLRKGLRRNAGEYGPNSRSVVAWYGRGVRWSCNACFVRSRALQMDSQIFLDGGPNRNAYADTVTLHELGHFTMWTHGYPTSESGTHCTFVPTLPGMAWSEAYAHWYSADIRRDGMYYSQSSGTFFYFDADLDPRLRGFWRPTLPDPLKGPLQRLDELWVTSSMRHIAREAGTSRPLWEAMVSPRMTVSPFARGYKAHRITKLDSGCNPIDPTPTDRPTPTFPDFLDALICGGMSPEIVDAVVRPEYPYPSHAPRCEVGGEGEKP